MESQVPVIVGIVLGVLIAVFARFTGFDRDRAFYPTALIVIASYYALFAVMGGSMPALMLELVGIAVFVGIAIAGFKGSPWIVAAGIAGHGVFDFVRIGLIDNPGMPEWWPPFCASIDITIGVCLAWLLYTGRLRTPASADRK